jgi:hypothetical protein
LDGLRGEQLNDFYMYQKTKNRILKYKRYYRKFLNLIKPYKQNRISRNSVKISAYISIYNDGDFIVTVLEHIKDYVDEIVIVDGAFEWMVPYLERLGVDVLRSTSSIYDAINASGIPHRIINKTWKNELEKRKAGYEACSHRYVMRVDADEILFFNDQCLEEFIGSGCAVAEMQFPLYLAPGWVVGSSSIFKYPAQCLIFDSEKISSSQHLEYLWLVLPADSLPEATSKTYPIYEKPVAFGAHLSVWRSTATAVNRAVFYISNWIRKHGVPWVGNTPNATSITFSRLFEFIPADKFRDAMRRCHVAFGITRLSPGEVIVPTPLTKEQERHFSIYYDSYITGLTELNKKSRDLAQTFLHGESIYFDITSDSAREAISSFNIVHIEFSSIVNTATATLVTLRTEVPYLARDDLPCNIEGNTVSFDISPHARHGDALRQFIELKVGGVKGDAYGHFQMVERVSNALEK